jgi:hypothetical protein
MKGVHAYRQHTGHQTGASLAGWITCWYWRTSWCRCGGVPCSPPFPKRFQALLNYLRHVFHTGKPRIPDNIWQDTPSKTPLYAATMANTSCTRSNSSELISKLEDATSNSASGGQQVRPACPTFPARLSPMPAITESFSPRRTPANFYAALPPLTRLLFTIYLITGLGTLLGVTPLK